MRELHIALVHLPPLLADLICQSVLGKVPFEIDVVIPKGTKPEAPLWNINVFILGQTDAQIDFSNMLAVNVPILTISSDLKRFQISACHAPVPFTVDTLLEELRRIVNDLDPSPPPFPDPMTDS